MQIGTEILCRKQKNRQTFLQRIEEMFTKWNATTWRDTNPDPPPLLHVDYILSIDPKV